MKYKSGLFEDLPSGTDIEDLIDKAGATPYGIDEGYTFTLDQLRSFIDLLVDDVSEDMRIYMIELFERRAKRGEV